MLTFEPFRIWCIKEKKNRGTLRKECNFATTTVAKIWRDGLPVRSDIIETICRVYGLRVEQVIEYRGDGR